MAKSESAHERRYHTGTDYWLIRSVSNPDNTTKEQPLSLAVTDERSNCRSTRTSQTTVETNQYHTCRHTAAGPCLAPLGTSWGPVSTTGVRTPNYERATSDYTPTNTSRCPTVVFPSAGRTT
ncbi:hypothetical protein Taro_041699 [Colocasia esculenta]|uniref:Uncharacterized protein n=1 Tax=Colocasia esculenta TaxID=4460 RepID=A0A843WM39_COLES|nr:hypothetical protein [Colocasia esculenta]